jgi:hypothetical protein
LSNSKFRKYALGLIKNSAEKNILRGWVKYVWRAPLEE